jgi:hypothetical protein
MWRMRLLLSPLGALQSDTFNILHRYVDTFAEQQTSITVYRLSTVSNCCLQKQTEICRFRWFCFPYICMICIYIRVCVSICIYAAISNGSPGKFFLNPFTMCSLCKRKFVICPFVDEVTSGSCLFTNG